MNPVEAINLKNITAKIKESPSGISSESSEKEVRRKFEKVQSKLEPEISQLELEANEISKRIAEVRSEVLGFRKLAIKALKTAVGIKIGKIDEKDKLLKENIEELKRLIPQFIQKIIQFQSSSDSQLKSLNPKFDELYRDIEAYRKEFKRRCDLIRSSLGPLSSQILSISATYFNALNKIKKLKAGVELAKKARFALSALSAAPAAPVIIAIAVVFSIVFIGIVVVSAVQRSTENPGEAIDTLFNAQCIDASDPDCIRRLIETSVDKQMQDRVI